MYQAGLGSDTRSGVREHALRCMKQSMRTGQQASGDIAPLPQGLQDPGTAIAAELRHLRLLVHDAMERTELAPIALKQDVTEAFSAVRTLVTSLVSDDRKRSQCLEAVEDCESKCRFRLTSLLAQHLSFLHELVGPENLPREMQKTHAKRKEVEFDELKRIPDLSFLSQYPQVPAAIVSPDFSRGSHLARSSSQKDMVHVSQVRKKRVDLKFPKPWTHLPGRPGSERSLRGQSGSAGQRPASSLGISGTEERLHSSMTIAAHHAVPNLQEGRLPTAVEHWPARSTHSPHSAMMQSTDMFLGAGPDMADVVPARGYLNMTALSLETEIANTRRPVIAKPAELVKIEQFIDVEFKRANIPLDQFNSRRLNIFRRAFESAAQTFKSWSPLFKTIQREYDAYVSRLETDSELNSSLKQRLTDLEEDYAHKFELMRNELSTVAERATIETDLAIKNSEESMQGQLERIVALEEELKEERSASAKLGSRLPEVENQMKILLKAYNEILKDCRRIVQASGCSSLEELCTTIKSMVHIQALTDLDQRLVGEKQILMEERDKWHERFNEMQNQKQLVEQQLVEHELRMRMKL